jgi:hypothetical protein
MDESNSNNYKLTDHINEEIRKNFQLYKIINHQRILQRKN